MADKYASFQDMAKHETEGVDYKVQYEIRNSTVAIVAPHGGGISTGSSGCSRGAIGDLIEIFEAIVIRLEQRHRVVDAQHRHFLRVRCESVLAKNRESGRLSGSMWRNSNGIVLLARQG